MQLKYHMVTIEDLVPEEHLLQKVFRQLFERVAQQCIDLGIASGRLVATDSTHVKASAAPVSIYLAQAAKEPGTYWERLNTYEEEAGEHLAQKQENQKRNG